MIRVLVVEDEEYLVEAIATGLRRKAMVVDVVGDRANALEQVAVSDYDIIILDRGPLMVHGDETYQRVVRDRPNTRVLMLTASWMLGVRVDGFELGTDDCLTKSFELPELMARPRTLRRHSQSARTPVLEVHEVRLDPFHREVYRGGHFIHLSPRKFAVLQVLVEAEGGVLSAETFLEKVWDANADPSTNSTRVTISRLRRKLGELRVIQTVPDTGYKFST